MVNKHPPHTLPTPPQPEKTKQRMKMVMRCVALGMIPLTVNMPAGVFCYWAASNTFSLVQVGGPRGVGFGV